MKKANGLLIAVFLSFAACAVGAPAPVADTGDAVTIYVGEMQIVPVNTPTRVVIGNPDVADVASVSENELAIAGKSPGTTTLVWWDTKGEHNAKLRVFAEHMSEIKYRIDNLLADVGFPGIIAKSADSEGKVLLIGRVKTQAEMDRIKGALGPLFSKVTSLITIDEERAIIELDVEVLEVDRDASKTLGIKWPSALTATETAGLNKVRDIPESLFHVSDWTHAQLTSSVDMLVTEGKARILSRPRLACQSGKEAELLVGGEKPILTTQIASSGSGSGTSVEYKEYGIKLKMAPVYTEGKIKLAMNVDVSDLGTVETLGTTSEGTVTTTAKAYPLVKRSTSTQLFLNNGQTLAISGLIRQKSTEDLQKVPWLGEIPVLGLFFRHRSTGTGGGSGERGDIELVIMVTPRVVTEQQSDTALPAAEQKVVAQPDPGPAKSAPESAPAAVSPKVTPAKKAVVPAPVLSPQDRFGRTVTGFFLEKLVYPSIAKRTRTQGTVVLALHLAADGTLLDASVKKSSGSAILDEQSLSTAKNIQPYPGFPRDITDKDIWIQIPIEYNLAGSR